MFERINSLAVKGGCFVDETIFNIFPKQRHRISVIFGRNGSGKSTISRALAKLAGNEELINIQGRFVADTSAVINSEYFKNIFVFNEDFVDTNIKIETEGLHAVVLFGEQLELDKEIEKNESLLNEMKTELESKTSEFAKYEVKESTCNPHYFLERAMDELREHWADRYRQIKGNTVRGRVNDSLCFDISKLVVTEEKEALKEDFESKIDLLRNSLTLPLEFAQPISTIRFEPDFEDKLSQILSKNLDDIKPTERENKILNIITSGRQHLVEDAKTFLNKKEVTYCPYCLQELSEEYKSQLITSIKNVLNEEIDKYKRELKSVKFPNIFVDVSKCEKIIPGCGNNLKKLIDNCNKDIAEYKKLIEERECNIYSLVVFKKNSLSEHLNELNNLLSNIEQRRLTFVSTAQQTEKLRTDLELISKKIAFYEIKRDYEQYKIQNDSMIKSKNEIECIKTNCLKVTNELNDLNARKMQIDLAVDEINRGLSYIFCANERLSVSLENGKYIIKSRGRAVLPKDISVGERNAIALCYFFVDACKNRNISNLYEQESLIVLDDPVSSFDFENKIGILSYVNRELGKFLNGNSHSRSIVLTHDITIFQDLSKVFVRILGDNKNIVSFRLENNSFIENGNGLSPDSEYKILLSQIAKYADDMDKDLEFSIGNSCRRIYEAYITFLLGKNLHNSLKDIKDHLGKYANYFESLMIKTIMNEESHCEDRVSGLRDDMQFGPYITSYAKRKMCRDILCLMYLLTPFHVKLYLADYVENIKCWKDEIPEI